MSSSSFYASIFDTYNLNPLPPSFTFAAVFFRPTLFLSCNWLSRFACAQDRFLLQVYTTYGVLAFNSCAHFFHFRFSFFVGFYILGWRV
ncbi:hypothetical protein BDZ91DRAFT_710024 [Kalaharituber pfeilii]|nr:hypothetical protein BDZ91DRAFT_710024 [Kalaharituber pfeilii]